MNLPYLIKARARRGRAPPLRRSLPPCSSPRLAAPGGALAAAGMKWETPSVAGAVGCAECTGTLHATHTDALYARLHS